MCEKESELPYSDTVSTATLGITSTLQKSQPPNRHPTADLGLSNDGEDEDNLASCVVPTTPSCTIALDNDNDDETLHHPIADPCL